MPRSQRAPSLETRTARLKLKIRKKPYWLPIGDGVSLGYRRNRGPGSWSVRVANGGRGGGHWTQAMAAADDHAEATADTVLTFWQAQAKARGFGVSSRQSDESGKLDTVAAAIEAYAADLKARGGHKGNVTRIKHRLPPTLAAKTVATLTARDFKVWRAALQGLTPASINRSHKALKAALNFAAKHDERITNSRAWRFGLASLPDANKSRNVILDAETVRKVVAGAYQVSPEFGLWIELAAVTGARVSQIARLQIADLQVAAARLMMPSSRKGRGVKKVTRAPVPILAELAVRLQAIAKGRAAGDALLVNPEGEPWGSQEHSRPFTRALEFAGLDKIEPKITAYALRHSSIVRQILSGTPIRLVAAAHDTSVAMIERNYSEHITDVGDTALRRGMLDIGAPADDKIVSLRR
jgi:integrase